MATECTCSSGRSAWDEMQASLLAVSDQNKEMEHEVTTFRHDLAVLRKKIEGMEIEMDSMRDTCNNRRVPVPMSLSLSGDHPFSQTVSTATVTTFHQRNRPSSALNILFHLMGADLRKNKNCCFALTWVAVFVYFVTWWLRGARREWNNADLCKYSGDMLFFIAALIHWLSCILLWPRCSPSKLCGVVLLFVGASVCLFSSVGIVQNLIPGMGHTGEWVLSTPVLLLNFMSCWSHAASALLFQGDCDALSGSLLRLPAGAAYDRFAFKVQVIKTRWRMFLLMHLVPEFCAMALYTFSAVLASKRCNWKDILVHSMFTIAAMCLMLCQLVPLVAYNEAVNARLVLENHPTTERFNRKRMAWTFLGMAFERRYFAVLFSAGASSSFSPLIGHIIQGLMDH